MNMKNKSEFKKNLFQKITWKQNKNKPFLDYVKLPEEKKNSNSLLVIEI